MIEIFLLFVILLALGAAIIARQRARQLRAQSGLPTHARVVYSDTGAWRKVEKPLFSRRYQLVGKPDYIVEDENGAKVPIEVKPNRVAIEPRLSDTLQLAAYGLLLEESFGTAPPYGLLKYRDQVFRVDFTDQLREELLAVMEEMRSDLQATDVARSHEDPRRCRACGYRAGCGQALSE